MRHGGKMLRGLISIALLAWLFAQVDLGELRRTLLTAEARWLLIAHLLTPLTLAFGVLKWWLLLRARGVTLPAGALSRYYLIGAFWNNFLPSNFGGDVVRAVFAIRRAGRAAWPLVASSIAVERLTGLYGLFVALAAGLLLHWSWVAELGLLLPLGLATLAVAGGSLLVFGPSGRWLLDRLHRLPRGGRLLRPVDTLYGAILAYARVPGVIVQCLALSVAFYVVAALQLGLLLAAFPHVEAAWTTQLVTFCSLSLVALLPVSINGYGVQEGGYVLMLTSLGFTLDEALVVALAIRLILLAPAVVGGVLFAWSDLSREDIERELAAGAPAVAGRG